MKRCCGSKRLADVAHNYRFGTEQRRRTDRWRHSCCHYSVLSTDFLITSIELTRVAECLLVDTASKHSSPFLLPSDHGRQVSGSAG